MRLGCAGTHAFSLFERQQVTGRDRYRALLDALQYAARRELIFGLHVHVAVEIRSGDPLMSALQPHLCELVALSASSPFWRGEPTGFASCRHVIFSAFPRSGPPPQLRSYEEYAQAVRQLVEPVRRGLHADLVGRAAPRAFRHHRGACDGRGHPGRRCGRARRVRSGALCSRSGRRPGGQAAPDAIRSSPTRTNGVQPATGWRPWWSIPPPAGRSPGRADRADARGSGPTPASSGARASSTAFAGSCATATARTASAPSTRRPATSARSRAGSPT